VGKKGIGFGDYVSTSKKKKKKKIKNNPTKKKKKIRKNAKSCKTQKTMRGGVIVRESKPQQKISAA